MGVPGVVSQESRGRIFPATGGYLGFLLARRAIERGSVSPRLRATCLAGSLEPSCRAREVRASPEQRRSALAPFLLLDRLLLDPVELVQADEGLDLVARGDALLVA